MKNKITVAILFGGQSPEHEVSLQSARNVVEAIDRERFDILLLGINKYGAWFLYDEKDYLVNSDSIKDIKLAESKRPVVLVKTGEKGQKGVLLSLAENSKTYPIDIVFPLLHGPFGEDGTVQGLLKLMEVPFVGAGVLGSSVAMDKDIMKRLFCEAGIQTAPFEVYHAVDKDKIDAQALADKLGLPIIIKPANLGSSVGISKVKDLKSFGSAVKEAFLYDNKIIIEKYIVGREIECSVLGNEKPRASLPGEIVSDEKHGFYSYDAKYIDDEGAQLIAPAKLTDKQIDMIQTMAIKAYKTLACEGMGRVDMFITAQDEIYMNEINTIPGFANISMYPRMWAASGLAYKDLISELIELGLQRAKAEAKLKMCR